MRELQNGRRKEIQKKSLDSHEPMCEQYKKWIFFLQKCIFSITKGYKKCTKVNKKRTIKCTKKWVTINWLG